MICVIVPSHNQSQYIERIIKGYEEQYTKPDIVLFVFDRCADNSVEKIKTIVTDLDVRYLEKSFGDNFSAGMTRDYGVDYINYNFNYEMIVFTDGDCVPSKHLIKDHLENIIQTNKAIVSCGKRYCETVDGEWEDDERNIGKWVNGFGFGRNGRIVLSNKLTIDNILTYSCNLAFNHKAIQLCKHINREISDCDRVFNKEFDGSWGGEDNFISHCLYLTNNWIVLASNKCFVNHYYHKEEKKDVEYKNSIVKKLSNKLKDKIVWGLIEGEVTKVYKNTLDKPFDIDLRHYAYSEPFDLDIDHNYNKPLFDACVNLTYNRVILFDGYKDIKINYKEKELEEIIEYLNYVKLYLRNDTIKYVNDKDKFVYNSTKYDFTYKPINT